MIKISGTFSRPGGFQSLFRERMRGPTAEAMKCLPSPTELRSQPTETIANFESIRHPIIRTASSLIPGIRMK